MVGVAYSYSLCLSFSDQNTTYLVQISSSVNDIPKQDRIYTHSKNEDLHKYISPDVLPKKLGGKIEEFNNKECYASLLKFEEYFQDVNKMVEANKGKLK